MSEKDINVNYIKAVKKLTNIKTICEQLGLGNTNISNGRTTDENIAKVASVLKENIKKLAQED